MRLPAFVTATLVVAALSATASGESARSLATRAAAYVRELDRQLPAIVGTEQYVQVESVHDVKVKLPRPVPERCDAADLASRSTLTCHERHMRADIAWVPASAVDDVLAVREVVEVDGRPVRAGRLMELLKGGSETDRIARELLAESATYNLVEGSRNLNLPTFPLVYLRGDRGRLLKWRVESREGTRIVLAFEEHQRPSVVKTADGRPLMATGRLWIEPESGRVERCEIRFQSKAGGTRSGSSGPRVTTRIAYSMTVFFREDARLGIWLPVRMEELYQTEEEDGRRRESRDVRGVATYGNYRRYETGGRLLP